MSDSKVTAATLQPTRHWGDWLLAGVLVGFVGMWALGLLAGIEPEFALGRAALVAVLLAVLARVTRGVLDQASHAAAEAARQAAAPAPLLDVTIGDEDESPVAAEGYAAAPVPPIASPTTATAGGS